MAATIVHLDGATPLRDAAPSVVVIGNFDGVHRGHQSVVREAIAEATSRRLVPTVLTFDPHPAVVLGRGAPPLLTTIERRAELLGELGIAKMIVRRFDRDFAASSPEAFARDFVSGELCAKMVVVGENFRFGSKRAGDLKMLEAFGAAYGFEACPHGVAADARGPYSSTRAREAIARGEIEEAIHVLGRPHSFLGTVVRGAQRGRTIGFPTANVSAIAEVLPPNGVYAVLIDEIAGAARILGVMNVGVRPTIDEGASRSVEAHLFDTDRDLYGKSLRVHLVARLRDEQRFDGLDALKAQIARDASAARATLETFVRTHA